MQARHFRFHSRYQAPRGAGTLRAAPSVLRQHPGLLQGSFAPQSLETRVVRLSIRRRVCTLADITIEPQGHRRDVLSFPAVSFAELGLAPLPPAIDCVMEAACSSKERR